MSRGEADRSVSLPDVTDVPVTRRQALKALVGGSAVAGAAKAVDNVLVGYGTVTGTNLLEQDLGSLANQDFRPGRNRRMAVAGHAITTTPSTIYVSEPDSNYATAIPATPAAVDAAADLDAEYGLPGALEELTADLAAITADEHEFEFYRFDAFFDRVATADSRPFTVEAVRHWPGTDAALVTRFADADPTDPRAVLRGLVGGFREHSYYDTPRYVGGSITDNVIFGAADLRAPFRTPVDFESLLGRDGAAGMFCYEFTYRSIEAMHAVPAHEQTAPVVAAHVYDERHKHVYTAVASVVRDGDALRVPATFVDYTHTTLYDDFHLTPLLGEGFEAYNARHRATAINWSP